MKKYLISIILILTLNFSFAQNKRDSLFTHIGYSTEINSEILKQRKKLYIHLPSRFDKNKEYPLVVLLDFMAFKPLASIAEIMAYNQTIPECIVVCPVTTDARNEYSPVMDEKSATLNGGKTIQFYEKELLPFLQSKYKISKKILWGQNFSGMFSTFVMLTKPGLFDAYFSDVPKLDLIAENIKSNDVFKNLADKKVFYYLTGSKLFKQGEATQNLLAKLKSNAPKGLKWNYAEQSDTVIIAHVATNYIYGLKMFLSDM